MVNTKMNFDEMGGILLVPDELRIIIIIIVIIIKIIN
jgi:hypothetical protein